MPPGPPTGSIGGGAPPTEPVPALRALLEALTAAGVRYCLWKSNVHVAAALAGDTDLDLLVDRGHTLRFREVLHRHRVHPLVPPRGGAYPATEHYLGFDPPSGRLFHLHVHYQLVLGERYVKNYRLPVEGHLLHARRLLAGVPVPAAAVELALLAVRILLKYRLRDAVKDVLGIRSPGVPEDVHAEVRWLLDQTSLGEVGAILRAWGEIVPVALASDALETVVHDRRPGLALLLLRTRLRAALRDHRRSAVLRARLRYAVALLHRRRWPRLRPWDDRMTPATGGLSAALVGSDGSGKSATAELLARWLGWKVAVVVRYMGSKQPSRRSRWLYLAFRALRRGQRALARRAGADARPARLAAGARDVALALHHLAVAGDRVRRYRAACRDVHAGRVVLFDRFPLEALSSLPEHRLLDGPQISAALGTPGRLVAALARVEERRYACFRLPDVLVLLDVSPELGAQRKPDHRPEILAVKSRAVVELAALARASRGLVRVWQTDANRPLGVMVADIKSRLWDVL